MRKAIIVSLILSSIMFLFLQFASDCDARPRPPHPLFFVSWFHPWFPFWAPPRVIILRGGNYGYLDLDVHPEEAEVYIDGQLMGVCDRFDGFPDYLYLEAGTYTIRFSLDGYLDYEQRILIRPGRELEFNTRLERGSQSDYQAERSARPGSELEQGPETTFDEYESDYQAGQENESAVASPAAPSEMSLPSGEKDETASSGFIRFRIFPREATIYFDGKFIGVAHDLNDREESIELPSGSHVIEIMMPGHEPASQEVTVLEGETMQVRVILIKVSLSD